LGELTPHQVSAVKASLRAAAEGPFFPDWEFQTLFGVERDLVGRLSHDLHDTTVAESDKECAVMNTLAHLLGYPHGRDTDLLTYVPDGREELALIAAQLREP